MARVSLIALRHVVQAWAGRRGGVGHACVYGIEVTQAVAVEAAGFEAGDSAPSGCIEQVARACVHARARVCAYVLLSSFVCCVCVCTCVRVRACARVRVRVFMSGRARVGDSVVVVCSVVWCGVVWFAYRRASMMAGRGPRRRLMRDLCLPLLPLAPPPLKERR